MVAFTKWGCSTGFKSLKSYNKQFCAVLSEKDRAELFFDAQNILFSIKIIQHGYSDRYNLDRNSLTGNRN